MTEAGLTVTLRQLPDLLDFLDALNGAKAKYLVVGGHAVGLHGHSRATKDLDVWIGEDAVNRDAVIRALGAFGAPESAVHNLASASRDEFVFLGHPPQRIDLLQGVPGVEDFEGSYARRACVSIEGVDVNVIGFEDLLVAKRAAGRPQDLVDVARLEKVRAKELELGRERDPSKGRGRDDWDR
ncbi:MAG: DUF6036 family nucleotidyltransferase [Polyangiales bacterium]